VVALFNADLIERDDDGPRATAGSLTVEVYVALTAA
jgi:hypothetical protein